MKSSITTVSLAKLGFVILKVVGVQILPCRSRARQLHRSKQEETYWVYTHRHNACKYHNNSLANHDATDDPWSRIVTLLCSVCPVFVKNAKQDKDDLHVGITHHSIDKAHFFELALTRLKLIQYMPKLLEIMCVFGVYFALCQSQWFVSLAGSEITS